MTALRDIPVTTDLTASSAVFPVGLIMPFAKLAAPAGWLFCDGATYDIAQYPDLGAALGTTYGGTAGSTFSVPDLRGRTPFGGNGIGGNGDAGLFGTQRGGVNGGATFTLTSAYTPYHTHDFSMTVSGSSSANGAHNHVYDKQIDSEFGGINVLYPDNMPRFQFNWSGGDDSSSAAFAETRSSGTSLAVYRSTTHDTGDHTHSWSGGVSGNMYWESPGGAASAFSILPPHVTVNYIIKT
jgi:microcystin-dependent protein